MDEPPLTDPLEGPFTCWCGATGDWDELFDDSGLDDTCGGTGSLQCVCGGDFCVCHYHGETECPGCEDCEEEHDDFDEDFDDYLDEDKSH